MLHAILTISFVFFGCSEYNAYLCANYQVL